eukprot:6091945-Prymnesium_polylepis.1
MQCDGESTHEPRRPFGDACCVVCVCSVARPASEAELCDPAKARSSLHLPAAGWVHGREDDSEGRPRTPPKARGAQTGRRVRGRLGGGRHIVTARHIVMGHECGCAALSGEVPLVRLDKSGR